MKIVNLILLTTIVAIILLSSSSSGKVDAFNPDCWRGMTSWYLTSCNSNYDCRNGYWCQSNTCQPKSNNFIDLCKKKCSVNQLCLRRSTDSVDCKSLGANCKVVYDGWLSYTYVCETNVEYHFVHN
ncbi:hypothetical protein G9C98_005922 [Cotesia typhae]|uniref:Uncharacterized protein n=1 Tax=Cotesia typhae TaxID=2053667 RepID=A0A8J5UYL2_9HYME|nr:hypothetical protein G9C98_005922 [Cotesia typhae]